MNAEDFRHLYDYHFTRNHMVWERSVMALSDADFLKEHDYSIGSIRNQTVHMMSIDQRWFCGLRQINVPDFLNSNDFPDRPSVRSFWDQVEAEMFGYLAGLTDEAVDAAFVGIPDTKNWQIMYHVLNHGTDHRAQLLAMLANLGAPTFPQDYFFFVRGIPI